jgi:sugar phosphate permease
MSAGAALTCGSPGDLSAQSADRGKAFGATHPVYRKIFWRIVPLLMLCYVVSYLNRVNVGFAKLEMAGNEGFSDTVFGLGAGLFFLSYVLFELPSNLLMQRVGARIWLARIMITWGLLSSAFCFVHTPLSFYVMRFLLGAAEAGFFPGVVVYLTFWFPPVQRARIMALFMSAIPVAGIVGNPLSGWIMETLHAAHRFAGWQWMFLIEGVPAIFLGIVLLLMLDNDVPSAGWLSQEEKRLVMSETAVVLPPGLSAPHSIAELLRNRYVLLLCPIYFAIIMGQYGLTFWMPTLIRTAGAAGSLRLGVLSAVPFLAAIVVMNVFGISSDRLHERRWHMVVPAFTGALSFLILATSVHGLGASVFWLSAAAAGVLTCTPLFWPLPTAFLSGTAAVAGIAIINSMGNLAGFVSPLLIGYLMDATHSAASAMYLLAVVLGMGAVGVILLPARLVDQ